ncbi:MAG: hypothetical protein ACD_13C00264G0003, partial [uncultured bacterium]
SEGHARALAAIDDSNLMIEAYKIVLKESGSVRRAEELARRMKVKSNQEVKKADEHVRIVSEEIDKMQEDMEKALAPSKNGIESSRKNSVKLIRSRRETRVVFVLKGGLDETEIILQKIYRSVTS